MTGMDLVEFLTARLDEDEQAARDAHYEGQRWISEEEGVWRWPDDEAVHTADRKRDAAHIARWDPAHVLADVAAKRQIIEEQTNAGACQGHPGPWMPHADYRDHDGGYCRDYDGNSTLRWLASPYADHPDYQPEWKP